MRKEVVIASFRDSLSRAMRDTADRVIELDDFLDEITKTVYNYTCVDCGKAFYMVFSLDIARARCPECHRNFLDSRR